MMLKLKSAHAANYGLCCVVPHFHVCPNRVALAHHGLARGANCSRQIDRAICSRRSVNVQCKASSQPYAVGTVVRPPGAQNEIRWGSYVSTKEDLPDAIEEAVDRIMGSIGNDSQPELAIVFVSSTHGPDYSTVVPLLRKRLPSLKHVFGCSVSTCMGHGWIACSHTTRGAHSNTHQVHVALLMQPTIVQHSSMPSIPLRPCCIRLHSMHN